MKVLITSLLIIISTVCYSQADSIYLVKSTDKMTKTTMHLPNRYLKLMDKTKKAGFEINPVITQERDLNMLFVKLFGLGTCHENSELIVLFTDGNNLTVSSFGKYNCDGMPVFILSESSKTTLKEIPIEAIRVTNGYTGKNATIDLLKRDQRYFIQLFKSLK